MVNKEQIKVKPETYDRLDKRRGFNGCITLDDIIYEALRKRREVKLFLCKDEQGGFGIKIDGIEVDRNLAWELFEIELDREMIDKIRSKLGFAKCEVEE